MVGASGTVRIGQSNFNGEGTVTASSLAVDFGITRTLPGTLAFVGGTVDFTANVSAPSLRVTSTTGAITLNAQSLTASTALSGQMTLDAATGISQTGGALVAPNFTAIARNGNIDLQAANTIGAIAGGVQATTNIPGRGFLNATRGLSASGSVALVTTGALTTSAITGAMEAGTTLTLSATSLTPGGASFSGGATTLIATGAGGISVSGTLRADAITLRSAGAVTKGGSGGFAGAADATTTALTILNAAGTAGSSAGGAVTITGGGNAIATLDAGATGALNVISANAMTVNRAVATTTVTLNGPSLALAGAVTAGAASTVSLSTTSGGITQSAGIITGGTLTVAAPGQVTLNAGDAARANPANWNAVSNLGAVTVTGGTNGFTFQGSNALTLTGAVTAPGAVQIFSNDTLTLNAAASVNTSAGNGAIALASRNLMSLAGTINSGTGQTTLTSLSGAINQTAGGITAGNFAASGVGVTLAGTNSYSGQLALAGGTGDVVIDQAGTVTLANITAPTVTGSVVISGFSGNNITITADGLTGTGGGTLLSATGNIILRVDALSLAGTITASTIAVGPKTAGSAVQIGSADTPTTLGFDGVTAAALTSAGRPLTIGETLIGADRVTAGDVTVGADVTATASLTLLSGGNISLPASITLTTGSTSVRMAATGNITQPNTTSGLTISGFLSSLFVRAGGAVSLNSPLNTIGQVAAAALNGDVSIVSSGTTRVNTGTSFALPGGGTVANFQGVNATGDVFLQASALEIISMPIASGANRTVTLRADSMALSGTVTASGGTVALETLTLGGTPRPITLGAEVANTLALTQAELNTITAGRLVIGRTDGTTGSAISVAGNVSLPAAVGALRLIGGSLALGANLDATGKTIEAFIGGATTRTTGFVSASLLDYRGINGTPGTDAGAVTLDGANRIGTLTLRSSGAVNIGLDANGGTTTISQLRGTSVTATGQGANGTISVNGGLVESTTGAFSLTGATTLNTLSAITGANGLTLSGGAVTIGAQATATAGLASLSSTTGALTLDAAVTAQNGGASFTGATGTQVNAAISTTNGGATFSGVGLTTAAAGTITVSGGNLSATNTGVVSIGAAVSNTTGSVSFTGGTSFTSTATITGATGLTLNAGSLLIGGALSVTGTGNAALTAGTSTITLNAGLTVANGGATFASTTATTVNGAVGITGGALGFTGVDFTSTGAGSLTVAGGNLTIANTGTVGIGGVVSNTTGSVSITGATSLATTASIAGATGLTLNAGSLLIDGALSVTGTGNAALTAGTSSITLNAGLTVANGGATFASTTSTSVNGAVGITGGALGFTGAGFTSNGAGSLTVAGGNLTIANTGTVGIGGVVSNTSGSVSITGGTALTTTATITGQTGVTLSAGSVTTGATVTATTGAASLTSTAGDVTLNAGVITLAGGASFASGTGATFVNAPVSVTGGDAGFTGVDFTSTAPGTITVANGNLTIANTGTVTIGGALETTTGSIGITGATTLNVNATITAANGLTLSAGTMTIGSALTVNSGALGLTTTVGDLTINASVTTLNGAATLDSAGATLVNAPVSVTGGALAISGVGFTSTAPGTLTVTTAHALGITNTGTVTIGGVISDTGGAVSITGGTTLGTTASITGQTGITLSAGSVTLGADVTANTGNAGVTGTAGSVTANAAVTATTGNVTLDATGAIVLNGAITSVAGGTVTLNAGAAAGSAADSITQTAAGIIGGGAGGTTNLVVAGRSLDAPVTLTQANRLATIDAQARGALALTSTGVLDVIRATSTGSGAATSSVTLTAASLSLTGAVNATTAGAVTLNALSGGITQLATGIITGASLSGQATGAVALASANNVVSSTGAFTLGADFTLLSTVGLTVTSALNTPGNAITLTATSLAIQGALTGGTVTLDATAGGITQTGAGVITTPSLIATATAGVNLNAGDAAASQTTAWNQVTTLASGSGGTGGFTLRNSRDLTVTGTVSAGSGQVLRLDVTGTPLLAATSALSAPSGTIVIAASGPVDLRGALTAGLSTITSATGAVTQTTGAITGGLAVQANGAVDVQNAANAITNLSANAIGGRVDVLSSTAMTVVTATNVALHGGTTTTISGVSGTTTFLTAPGLTLNAAVSATTGDVQLRADSMAIAAGVNASAGEVRIEQLTLGATPRGISLGAENAGALSLTTAELAAINTPTLILGRSTGTGAAAVAGQIAIAGAITVPGSVTTTLRLLGSGIAVGGTLNATGTATTELRALTQSITSSSGGVSGQSLIATAPFGSVTLSALNDFATVTGSSSAGGSFTYRDATGFQVVAPGITAASVSLTAETGTITQAAGAPIVAGSLFALARTGSALLDGGSAASGGADLNQVGSLTGGGASGGGVFRLRNATGFTIAGTLDNGAGGALGTAQLFAPTGGIAQTGGLIRADRLEVTLPGGGASFGQANDIATLGTSTIAGNLTLTNADSLALAGPVDVGSTAGGPVSTTTLTLNSGNLTQGTGARLRTDVLVASALGGDVLLTAGGSNSVNDLAQVGTLAGVSASGVVDLRLGTPTLVAGLLRAGSAAGTPTGALTLEAPGITIGTPGQGGTLIRAGTVVLRTQSGFDGPAGAPTGSIIQQGGAVEANALSVSAPTGNILMNRFENRFIALAAGRSANGSLSTRSLVAGGTIDIAEGGAGFTVQSGIGSGGLTRLAAANALSFNVATTLVAPITLTAGGQLTIGTAGQLTSSGTVTLSGGSILIQGSVSGPIVNATTGGVFNLSGGSVAASLDAPGAIDVTAGGVQSAGGSLAAHTIIMRAGGGGAQLDGTTFTATELVNITATGNMAVSGVVVNANAAQFRTPGLLALSGGSYTLGRVVVFGGAAGITTGAATVVRNRNPGTFPGIVYDTRQSLAGFDPLTIVQADIAGLPVNDQPTQVRTPNADLPGAFGPSSNAPAGNAQLRLDALQSPVFLLLDGGSFTGVFNTAGRIGVHGRGGAGQSTGVLVDPFGRRLEGQSTASLGDTTRPATGTEIARFRVNDCVISSFNCVAPTQVIVVPVTVPSIPPLAFGVGGRDPDAVSPNVAEEWSVRDDE